MAQPALVWRRGLRKRVRLSIRAQLNTQARLVDHNALVAPPLRLRLSLLPRRVAQARSRAAPRPFFATPPAITSRLTIPMKRFSTCEFPCRSSNSVLTGYWRWKIPIRCDSTPRCFRRSPCKTIRRGGRARSISWIERLRSWQLC